MKEKNVSMEIVNPHAAGIDVGSRSHFIAIGQDKDDVKEFGVFNEDIQLIIAWLLANGIKTVAMESTGTYWQNLFSALQAAGFQVILCNGKFTKNMNGKKTDVQDCQWIQKLHTLGLLRGSFPLERNSFCPSGSLCFAFLSSLPSFYFSKSNSDFFSRKCLFIF